MPVYQKIVLIEFCLLKSILDYWCDLFFEEAVHPVLSTTIDQSTFHCIDVLCDQNQNTFSLDSKQDYLHDVGQTIDF